MNGQDEKQVRPTSPLDRLVRRLRASAGLCPCEQGLLQHEAADEIERLCEALRPFAEHPPFHATDDWAVTQLDENAPDGKPVAGVTAGDFRRAANALGLTPNTALSRVADSGSDKN